MTNFSNIAALAIDGKEADLTLWELAETPKPVLRLRAAGRENRAYFNELLREFGGAAQFSRAGATTEVLDKQLAAVRRLYPLHVVTGWSGLRDANGELVPYSREVCADLFQNLPGDIVERIRAFAEEPQNFRNGALAPIDAETLSGN